MSAQLELLDWKRRVFALYHRVREADQPEEAWRDWRHTRDDLFANHPQTPLQAHDRERFEGLPYFDYDPGLRLLADVTEAEPRRYEIGTSGEGAYAFTRFATAEFELGGEPQSLELYLLEGYGGGLFLPFARRHPREGDLRRRAVSVRHRQGRRPRHRRRAPRARLQLRL